MDTYFEKKKKSNFGNLLRNLDKMWVTLVIHFSKISKNFEENISKI